MPEPSADEVLFEAQTPLGFSVRVTRAYWRRIVTVKHPVMEGEAETVKQTLRVPEEVRRSRSDPAVYLFYREQRSKRWTCVVAKRLNGDGFLITTCSTDAIK